MRRRATFGVALAGLIGVLAACGGPSVHGVTVAPDWVVPGQPARACADISWGSVVGGTWALTVSRTDPPPLDIATATGAQGVDPCVTFTAPTPGSYSTAVIASDGQAGFPDQHSFPFFVPDPVRSSDVVPLAAAGAHPADGPGPVVVGVTVEPVS